MPEIKTNCPFCGDTKGHRSVNTDKKVYYCFKCGRGGRLEGAPPVIKHEAKRVKEIELFSFKLMTQGAQPVYDYMTGRGFSPYTILAKVRWSPDLLNRAILPVYIRGKLVFWTARAIDKSQPRYLSSGYKSKIVYNIESARGWAVLCEGPLDALSSPNGIALYGKIPSETQLRLIISKFKAIYIAIDGDAPKERKALKEVLSKYIQVKEIRLNDDEDPAKIGFTEMVKRLREVGLRDPIKEEGMLP